MLSDESSSDSETGRFKCRTKTEDDSSKSRKEDSFRSSVRSRHSEKSSSSKFHRDIENSRSDRDRFDRYPRDRDRNRFRNSPIRRRPSRERSPARRSPERNRQESRSSFKPPSRSDSRDRSKHSRSRSQRSPERKKDLKEDIRRNIPPKEKSPDKSLQRSRDRVSFSPERQKRDGQPGSPKSWRKDRVSLSPQKSQRKDRIAISPDKSHRRNRIVLSPEKSNRRDRISISPEKARRSSRDRTSISPDYRSKRSEIHKPQPSEARKRKSESPIIIEEHSDPSDEVQPGSYYSMIPAVMKDKSEESSEIDSSDDEKLRAKLLNLERELHKTKKKKHKKKHRKKHSKSDKDSDHDTTAVEVSSTTDIPDVKTEQNNSQSEPVEVSSTQKSSQKESGEEGEIISDDDSQNQFEIDPSDLRHKLKRSTAKPDDKNVCGPALPPHLSKDSPSASSVMEGPVLPPHLKGKSKHIGPSIPDDMRKILSEKEHVHESSDEDVGIGPLPSGSENKWSEAHQRLEERALDMKIRKLDGHTLQKSNVKSREEWMLELPEGKAKYLGLEARSFRAKEGPDMSDRSSWTDTPEEKARKAAGIEKEEDADAALQREARARQISNRDEEQESAVKKHKKKHKREESLLELHQKKLKKKKKKEEKLEGEKKERRPFSRDVDLQVNRFDEAQKRSIIKKAQALDTRFSSGEAKYL